MAGVEAGVNKIMAGEKSGERISLSPTRWHWGEGKLNKNSKKRKISSGGAAQIL